MSLQVWLPLNGNLNNQGLSEVTVTNNGATIDSSGKIGSCYSFDTGKYLTVTKPVALTKEISYSCWVNISSWSSSSWDCILSLSTGTNWRDSRATLCRNGDRTNLTWNIANGSSQIQVNSNTSLSPNIWYHIVCTYDGAKLRIYINGVEDSSVSTSFVPNYSSAKLYIGSWNGNNYNLKGRLNDVRVYDHCLSAKEVKEISKGLICHYKLDNNGFGGENLILESRSVISGGGASGITSTYMDDGSLKVVATSGNGGWKSCVFSKDSNPNVGSKLSVGDTYTISLDVKVEEGSSLPNLFINEGNSYKALHPVNGRITPNNWFRAYYTSTWSEPGTSYGNISIHLWFGGAIGTFYFKNFKLEKGSKPTQWCPSPLDDNTLGLDSATESDCSGLSNNGTKIGGLSSSTNPLSIRYESCYDFDGNTGSIQIPNLATLVPSGEFTMNCWIYHDDTWSSKGYETIFGGPMGFELDAKKSSTNSPVLRAYNWGTGEAAYELNNWNMITMTRNASETKFYINGELKITGSAGTIPSGNYFIGAWRTSSEQNYKGKISDFRLYSTVLSAEDIKTLYNTSASVDKNGNMYAYEFKEV